MQRHDGAREFGSHLGAARGIELNPSDDFHGFTDLLRSDRFGPNAGRTCRLVRDRDPTLVGFERPSMGVVAFACHHHHVETVRFDENPLAPEVILFRFEFERGLFAVQTRDHDPGTDRFGIDGLVVTVGVETVFGRNTVFEDGNLDSEVAVTKHATVVWTALVFALCGCLFFGSFRRIRRLAAGGKCRCKARSKE